MFTLIIFGVLAILVIIAVSTFNSGRNSRLPEEVKMQRYQTKQEAKANTGGAIVMFVMIGFVIYAVAKAFGVDPGQDHKPLSLQRRARCNSRRNASDRHYQ